MASELVGRRFACLVPFPVFTGFSTSSLGWSPLWESFKNGCNKRGLAGVREAFPPFSLWAGLGLSLSWVGGLELCGAHIHPTQALLVFSFTSASW